MEREAVFPCSYKTVRTDRSGCKGFARYGRYTVVIIKTRSGNQCIFWNCRTSKRFMEKRKTR